MSYVVNGLTYDEGGFQIDAFGRRIGGQDPQVAIDQPLSATAAQQRTTVTAIVAAKRIAATNPGTLSKAPVMPLAARSAVAVPRPGVTPATPGALQASTFGGFSPITLALAAGAAWWLWKKGI